MPLGIRAAVPDPDSSTGGQAGSLFDHAMSLFRPLIQFVENLFSPYEPYDPAATEWTVSASAETSGDLVTLLSFAAGAAAVGIVGLVWLRRMKSPAGPRPVTVSR